MLEDLQSLWNSKNTANTRKNMSKIYIEKAKPFGSIALCRLDWITN